MTKIYQASHTVYRQHMWERINSLQCAVGVYNMHSFVSSNISFIITFSIMTVLVLVWLLAVTGSVDLL